MNLSPRLKMLGAVVGAVVIALGVGLMGSRGHPVGGGLATGVMAGTLLAFGYVLRRSLPRVGLGLAVGGGLALALEAELSLAAAQYGLWAAAAAFAAWFVLVEVVGLGMVNREKVTPVTDLGGSGSAGRALIVFHSLGGRFQPAVERALAAGLQTQGWQVHLTTASHATPTDLSGYRLLVLGAPTFAAQPARAILAFLRRVRDLRGMAVMLVVSGQGTTELAVEMLQSAVVAANGRIVDALEIWTERDNLERHGLSDPLEILRRRGEHLHVA